MIIEAREDAKQGRPPDSLALRMIAKALEVAAAPRKGRPPGSKNAPKATAPTRATTAPGDIDTSAVATMKVTPGPGLKDVPIRLANHGHGGAAGADDDVDEGEELPSVAAARRLAQLGLELRDPTDEEIANGPAGIKVVGTIDVAPKKNGHDLKTWDEIRDNKLSPDARARVDAWVENEIAALGEASERTDAEWVAHAADVIEHLDMPARAELCGELYALAQRLEENPLPDPTAAPLLERVEAEIERRIEKAIKSSADLPAWVIEWAREERKNDVFRVRGGLDLADLAKD
jgi:hypothetical protein